MGQVVWHFLAENKDQSIVHSQYHPVAADDRFTPRYGPPWQSHLLKKGIRVWEPTKPNPLAGGSLQWRHNEQDGVSNHQLHDCLLNRVFRRRSKKTSRLRVTGLCAGNSPVTGEFPAQRASNAEKVSIWWRHDVCKTYHRMLNRAPAYFPINRLLKTQWLGYFCPWKI